jgi:hypothetical protein
VCTELGYPLLMDSVEWVVDGRAVKVAEGVDLIEAVEEVVELRLHSHGASCMAGLEHQSGAQALHTSCRRSSK